MKWIFHSFPDGMTSMIITVHFWDSVSIKLYNLATRRDPEAPHRLPAFHLILEILKLEVKFNGSGTSVIPISPKAAQSSLLLALRPLRVCYKMEPAKRCG